MSRVVETVRIAERPDALWTDIGRFGAVGQWHPLLSRVESEGERAGALRTAEGRDGNRQIERLLETAPARHSYRYRMEKTAMPVRDYTAEFRVDDNHDGSSTVVWSAEFEPTSDHARTVESVRNFLKAGVDNIAKLHGQQRPGHPLSGRMPKPERLVCRTDELDIAYERTAPVGGRPLVLVHGWPDDVRCWDKTIARLGGQDFCFYAPYLRGSGPTRFLRDATMRSGAIAALTLDLSQFLDALNLNDVVLAGYDWGARAAYGVAALFPQRVAALVTAAAGYATAIPPREMPYELAKAYWYEWYVATSQGEKAYHEDHRRLCRYLWETWSPEWPGRDSEFEAMAGSLDNPDWAAISIHAYRQRWHDAPGAAAHEDVERRLAEPPEIGVPTIMLQGADDRDNLPITSEHKERYFTNRFERRVLTGVGHFVPREAPDAVAAAILSMCGSAA